MDVDAKQKKPIARLLQAAGLDLDAARRLLVDPPNVLAANHLQQAAEKIISAVRLHRGLLNTKDHDLVILIDGAPLASHGRCLKETPGATASGPSRCAPSRRKVAVAPPSRWC